MFVYLFVCWNSKVLKLLIDAIKFQGYISYIMSEVPLLLFTKVPPEEAKQSCMHLWVGPYLEHTGPKNTCLTLFYSKDISVINTWNTFFLNSYFVNVFMKIHQGQIIQYALLHKLR